MPHTLLLADDSVTIRRVIELSFADESVRVVSVSSGREAMNAITAAPPDIILADAGMPDVSGYDIAAFVKGRAELRHIPVVLLAGAFEPLDEARARSSGSDGVLVKPFEPQMVVTRVRELLSQATAAQPSAAALPVDPMFDASLDRLDAAFSSAAQVPAIDETTATDFANDLRQLRSARPEPQGFDRQDFGDWDLPARAPAEARRFEALPSEIETGAEMLLPPAPEPVAPPLPPAITLAPRPPAPPVPPPAAPPAPAPAPAPAAPPAAPVYAAPASGSRPLPLADAFSSLLAAEEGRPHAPIRGLVTEAVPASASLSDADMDAIVDKVMARLGSGVRGAVIDLAERLVKTEIDRLKAMR